MRCVNVKRKRNQRGFAVLLELLLALAILMVILGMTTVSLISVQQGKNESQAEMAVAEIMLSETQYRLLYPTSGYASSATLISCDNPAAPTAASPCLANAALLNGQTFNHFYFAVSGVPATYTVYAWPDVAANGRRGFCGGSTQPNNMIYQFTAVFPASEPTGACAVAVTAIDQSPPQGLPGSNGAQGQAGQAGAQGPPGTAGTNGNSINSVTTNFTQPTCSAPLPNMAPTCTLSTGSSYNAATGTLSLTVSDGLPSLIAIGTVSSVCPPPTCAASVTNNVNGNNNTLNFQIPQGQAGSNGASSSAVLPMGGGIEMPYGTNFRVPVMYMPALGTSTLGTLYECQTLSLANCASGTFPAMTLHGFNVTLSCLTGSGDVAAATCQPGQPGFFLTLYDVTPSGVKTAVGACSNNFTSQAAFPNSSWVSTWACTVGLSYSLQSGDYLSISFTVPAQVLSDTMVAWQIY